MAGTTIEGRNCAVIFNSSIVFGIGTWKYTPGQSDELDDTEFGDVTEKIKIGIRKAGTIIFDGVAKKGLTCQLTLKYMYVNRMDVPLRLYLDLDTYLEPCQTSGYVSPDSWTGNATLPSRVNITSYDVSVDKNGLGKISFTAAVRGDMVEALHEGPGGV